MKPDQKLFSEKVGVFAATGHSEVGTIYVGRVHSAVTQHNPRSALRTDVLAEFDLLHADEYMRGC